jgi:hypothetical protein
MNGPALKPRITIRLEMPAPHPQGKLAQAKVAFAGGDTKTALKIVSNFFQGLTRDELHIFKDGYEAILYPGFFWQVHRDPNAAVERACALFRSKYLEESK